MTSSEGVRRSSDFYWDTVVFKVEGSLFRVPRHAFEEQSEVFRAMFELPKVGAEGQDDSTPITLEGYLESEFSAFLHVLYPTYRDLTTNGPSMTKAEWLSVLKLSTIWQMKEIRRIAVRHLTLSSKMTMNERYRYGRDYGIREWLLEALNHFSAVQPFDTTQTLQGAVGSQIACRILGIRLKSLMPPPSLCVKEGEKATFGVGRLICSQCNEPSFPSASRCPRCQDTFSLDDDSEALYYICQAEIDFTKPSLIRRKVKVDDILCSGCGNHPWHYDRHRCGACTATYQWDGEFFLSCHPSKSVARMVEEEFSTELGSCTRDE